MRLTIHTDYTLRVMMYLAVNFPRGGVATIEEISRAYSISRGHLMKIVNELAQHHFIETVRGRAGGARLARAPTEISVGQLVRMAEKDFTVVPCHDDTHDSHCAILPACSLKRGMRRAVDAFIGELDKFTLADTIMASSTPAMTAQLLGSSIVTEGTPAVAVPAPARPPPAKARKKPAARGDSRSAASAASSRRRARS